MAPPSDVTFGNLLRQLRKAAGLTQAELAELAGLSVRGLNDLERGARLTPRRDTVALLGDALGLTKEGRAAFVAAARRASIPPAQRAWHDLPDSVSRRQVERMYEAVPQLVPAD